MRKFMIVSSSIGIILLLFSFLMSKIDPTSLTPQNSQFPSQLEIPTFGKAIASIGRIIGNIYTFVLPPPSEPKILSKPGEGLFNLRINDNIWILIEGKAGVIEGQSALNVLSDLNIKSYGFDVATRQYLNDLAFFEGFIWGLSFFWIFISLIVYIIYTAKKKNNTSKENHEEQKSSLE